MARQLATAASFGTIGPAIVTDFENSDRAARLEAAHFRFSRRFREIERPFEAEASKLRQAYCDECAEIWERSEQDWGKGQPIVFSHGWPLSTDDWDTQMLFFLKHGYRIIAHDRRGHGRSTQGGCPSVTVALVSHNTLYIAPISGSVWRSLRLPPTDREMNAPGNYCGQYRYYE